MSNLPKKLHIYVYIVTLLASVLAVYMFNIYNMPNYYTLAIFILLCIFIESLAIALPNGGAVSVGSAISFSAIIILGPFGAALCTALGLMLSYVKYSPKEIQHIGNTPIYKTLFNGAQGFISIGLAGIIYYYLGATIGDPYFYKNIIPLMSAIILYLFISSIIITIALSFINEKPIFHVFITNIRWTLPNVFVISTLGIFISMLYLNYGIAIMLLFLGPVLLARHSFKLYLDMKNLYFETVFALTKAVEAKDPYTNGHSHRVTQYAEKLGEAMNLKPQRLETLKIASMLHDIGKIGVNDNILNKPATLTSDEMDEVMKHPEIGISILSNMNFLSEVRDIILKHHEKYDSSGYPCHLNKEEIPVEAFILSISDAYDAMTTDRPYRKAMSREKAMEIIKKDSGTHFHPQVAKAFIKILEAEAAEEKIKTANKMDGRIIAENSNVS